MTYTILKFAISAAILVAVSEISKRSSFIGGLLVSLPLTSLLAMMWLWHDTHDSAKISALSTSIFWLVLPSLGVSVAAMLASYGVMVFGLGKCGIKL